MIIFYFFIDKFFHSDYKRTMSKPITKLKKYRELKFMTLDELSQAAEVAIGTVWKAEQGRKVSLGSIKKLARALELKPEQLL